MEQNDSHMLPTFAVESLALLAWMGSYLMNADVEKAVESIARKAFAFDAMVAAGRISQELADESLALADGPIELTDAAAVKHALRDQEAELARHVKVLADCFRMAGADPDGNEDWRIAPDALRAVTDLRRDYDEVLDWQDRAEKADALLRFLLGRFGSYMDESDKQAVTAHLGGEHEWDPTRALLGLLVACGDRCVSRKRRHLRLGEIQESRP